MRPGERGWTEIVRALALCLGGLALMTLLSFGSVFLLRASGIATADIDQLQPEPGDIQSMLIYSLIAVVCCAAIVVLSEIVRRRASSRTTPL